nr:FAD-dependent oxidoreductase [Methylomarinum sp. Ch1-1]MDP4519168.1 FAD-dependent oxidoreductase [Methylomarinum sp. Ch1-1]
MEFYDVIVISAGTLGLQAAEQLKMHQANYLIIEQDEGATLRDASWDVAIKTLIETAHVFHTRNKYDALGIEGAQHVIANIPEILAHIRNVQDDLISGLFQRLEEHPVIHAQASFLDANTLKADSRSLKADKILICTGSKPIIPGIFRPLKADILTIDKLFEQEDLPQSLAVVGMGCRGAELGQALARLGIEVFAVEPTATIAAVSDPEINQTAQYIMRQDMRLYMETQLQTVEKEDGVYRLIGENKTLEVSGILLCAGRSPNLQGMGLNKLNIPYSGGTPVCDRQTLQIKGRPIYVTSVDDNGRSLPQSIARQNRLRTCIRDPRPSRT